MGDYSSYMWSVPDWRSDDVYLQLDNRGRGVYRELIDECWVTGSISSNLEILAKFVREPFDYFATVWAIIRRKFRSILRGKRLISKRLEKDRLRLQNLREKRQRSGHLGGVAAVKLQQRRRKDAERTHKESIETAEAQPSNSKELRSNAQIVPVAKSSQTQTTDTEGKGNKKEGESLTAVSVSSAGKTSPTTGAADLFRNYNEHRGILPEAKALTKERQRKCKTRLSGRHENFLREWTLAVQRAAALPFCCGEGAQGWTVSFDWLIANDTNYLKILEGKYDHVGAIRSPASDTDEAEHLKLVQEIFRKKK